MFNISYTQEDVRVPQNLGALMPSTVANCFNQVILPIRPGNITPLGMQFSPSFHG
jgi:hypothetical protein